MSNFNEAEAITRIEALVAELKAIELWDREYLKPPKPSPEMKESFIARGLRRTEILTDLRRIISEIEKYHRIIAVWSDPTTFFS